MGESSCECSSCECSSCYGYGCYSIASASGDVLPVSGSLPFFTLSSTGQFIVSILPDNIPEVEEVRIIFEGVAYCKGRGLLLWEGLTVMGGAYCHGRGLL